MKIADNEIPYLYLRALIDRNYGSIFNDFWSMFWAQARFVHQNMCFSLFQRVFWI